MYIKGAARYRKPIQDSGQRILTQNKLNILQICMFSWAEATFLKSFKICVATGDSNVGTGPIIRQLIDSLVFDTNINFILYSEFIYIA